MYSEYSEYWRILQKYKSTVILPVVQLPGTATAVGELGVYSSTAVPGTRTIHYDIPVDMKLKLPRRSLINDICVGIKD